MATNAHIRIPPILPPMTAEFSKAADVCGAAVVIAVVALLVEAVAGATSSLKRA